MDTPWQIQLLGGLSARKGDHCITRFATSRAAALLARLALFPRSTHAREELADLLWPEADLEAGRLSLRVCLASLRRQLEPPGTLTGSVLIADRTTVRLNPHSCQSDVAAFEAAIQEAARAQTLEKKREALDDALGLYGGELLPGFYDEWISDERERLTAVQENAQAERDALPAPKLPLTMPAPDPDAMPAAPTVPPKPLPSGFPLQFTRFFGREAERARLSGMLCDPNIALVTLIGPGGAGKTRLALETARQVAEGFSGSVCFAGLADLSDSALILVSIAAALRLPLSGESTPLAQVTAHLAAGESLLVLDNLEHLGEEGAAQIRALLAETPGLTCLVTSRRRLDLEGERELFLRPLPIPDSSAGGSGAPAALMCLPSVQLFVDRAQAVRPDFQITAHNAEAVAAICRTLEGMPLALELAAARIQTLTPAQMQAQLAARLDFLISRRRDLPSRHRSLRAALEWSTLLLTPEQTRFFVRLSVFRGGCTLESAAAVCETDRALPLLEELRERSLLAAEDPEEPGLSMRFRMLESLREFGEEHLSSEERRALNRRHAEYFQGFAAGMNALWNGPRKSDALAGLDAEYDNLRAALAFCRAAPPDEAWHGGETGMLLAASLSSYWTTRGLLREGLGWLEGASTGTGSAAARAGVLAGSGWLQASIGEYAQAAALLTESIALSRGLADRRALASALRMRGVSALWNGDYAHATPDLEEALALGRKVGDVVITAAALNNLGILAENPGRDKRKARALYEEALALFRHCGDVQRMAYCLHNLGNIAYDFGDYDRAENMLRESLTLADSLGDLWHRSYCLRSLGGVLLARGDLAGADALLEDGLALSRRLGDRMTEAGTVLEQSNVRRRQEDWVAAEALTRVALLLYQNMSHGEGRTECWMCLTEIAAAQSHWDRAACFLSAAALCREASPDDTENARMQGIRDSALATLGADAFAAAWEQGRTITCDDYGFRTA